jgi:O-antigen/teichoic acid export membrane protein
MKSPALSPERRDAPARGAASDARTVAKGGGIQVMGQFLNKGLTFAFTAVAVRVLGTAGFGLYREVFQILTIATMVAGGGFPNGSLRFVARARALDAHGAVRGSVRTTAWATVVSSAIVVTVVLVALDPIARAFADGNVGEVADMLLLGLAFVPLYALMQVYRSATQAYKTMVPSVVIGNIVQPLTRMAVGIVVLLLGFGVAGAISALVLSAALSFLAGVWYFGRLLTPAERSAPPVSEVGPILRFSFPQAGVTMLSTSRIGLGIILVGLFASDEQVGLFGVAQALQLAGNMFLTSIVAIFSAVAVGLHERGEWGRLESIYQTTNRWVATFGFPVLAALIVMPEFFARLLGGPDAAGAASIIPLLAIGNLFYVGTGPCGNLLSMTGRPGLNLVNSIVSVALYVGLGVWLVPIHGIVGMAWVDLAVTALVNIARVVEIKVILGVQPFGRSFLKPVVATAAAGAVLFAWTRVADASFVASAAGLALFALVYLGVLRIQGIDAEEREVYDTFKARLTRRAGKRRAPAE